jgi:SAM-dependent methyltransferase
MTEGPMIHDAILPHNTRAAATWNSAGRHYDRISYTIADSIEHCVHRLSPRPGEHVLDLATGTGWTARRVAARGAAVTGVDLGSSLIAAARVFAAEQGLSIDFQVGDAEKLPFDDQAFDVVVSTCGIMFVSDPETASRELARVCKKGGRLGLTTWPPDGTIAGLFKVMRAHVPAPPPSPPPSPFEWGRPDRVQGYLGEYFDLRFETGNTVLREPSAETVWDLFVQGYGPARFLADSLNPKQREDLKRDFIAYHARYQGDVGVAMPRDYLVTLGTRR